MITAGHTRTAVSINEAANALMRRKIAPPRRGAVQIPHTGHQNTDAIVPIAKGTWRTVDIVPTRPRHTFIGLQIAFLVCRAVLIGATTHDQHTPTAQGVTTIPVGTLFIALANRAIGNTPVGAGLADKARAAIRIPQALHAEPVSQIAFLVWRAVRIALTAGPADAPMLMAAEPLRALLIAITKIWTGFTLACIEIADLIASALLIPSTSIRPTEPLLGIASLPGPAFGIAGTI